MQSFFCAQESRESGEDPIANGENYLTYILIEFPPPWLKNAFDSKLIPPELHTLQEEIESTDDSVIFLAIYNESIQQKDAGRVIIYRQDCGLFTGYSKQELTVSNLNQVAPIIKEYLYNHKISINSVESPTRDILICTHGSRDKCCARYGNPFYRQAKRIVNNLSLNHVRIWQTSHFGGHRFAPTAIDFPEGRYYARLDAESFTAILTRKGNIDSIKPIYRGWGILPPAAQVLEREMMLMYGWEWFNYSIVGHVVEQSNHGNFYRVELNLKKPNGSSIRVIADVVADENKTCYLISYCDGTEKESAPQFCVKNMLVYSDEQ
jgi:hypothetical protein